MNTIKWWLLGFLCTVSVEVLIFIILLTGSLVCIGLGYLLYSPDVARAGFGIGLPGFAGLALLGFVRAVFALQEWAHTRRANKDWPTATSRAKLKVQANKWYS